MRPADRRRFLATQSVPRDQRDVVHLKLVASNKLPHQFPPEPAPDKPAIEHWLVGILFVAAWVLGLVALLS